ncbi:MAG: hypothetical protein ACP5KN_03430 [Armatimonadota bacterium]
MDEETMLHHLEELARRLEIEVRYESAAGRVGVGLLRGRRIAVIDAGLRVGERVAALASILADEDISDVYVPPAVRKRLQRSRPLRVRAADVSEVADELDESETDEPGAGDGPSGDTNANGADQEADTG